MGQTQAKKKNKDDRGPKLQIREEYFIENGGILQEKQLALSECRNIGLGQLKVFSYKDIEKATNKYDPDLIIGSLQSTVYKGMLDNRTIAVKATRDFQMNPKFINLFLTEAATSMVMNHENVLKIHGCCLETNIPIMIYEFVPNKSLFHHLHELSKSISWPERLKAATDTGYALSYMHHALSKPVVHRDVQSLNILLDHSFHAKLANFGHSVSITPGETPLKWPVLGTPGYIDPEHIKTHEVTAKCDVYSFGVLLLELLTRRLPSMIVNCHMSLVEEFVSAVRNDRMMEMIDNEVLDQARREDVQLIAQLALSCVAEKGMERPTMIDVVSKLWLLQEKLRFHEICS